MTISAELKHAYRSARAGLKGERSWILAAWGLEAEWRRRKAEWQRDWSIGNPHFAERETWTDAEWEEEVEKELSHDRPSR